MPSLYQGSSYLERCLKMQAFQWSLKPVLMFMKIFGIKLDVSNEMSYCSRIVTFIFLIILTSMTVLNCKILHIIHKIDYVFTPTDEIKDMTSEDKTQFLLHIVFILFSDAVTILLFFGPYLILILISVSGDWKKLWYNLMDIQSKFRLFEISLQQERKNCYLGLMIFLLDVILEMCLCYLRINQIKFPNPFDYYVLRGTILVSLPSMAFRVLLFHIIEIARFLFKELDVKIVSIVEQSANKTNYDGASVKLEDWRRQYEMVRRYVDDINRNFGLILLINVSWIFIQSAAVFYQAILLYAFFVIVSSRLNLFGVYWDVVLMEKSLTRNSTSWRANTIIHLKDDLLKLLTIESFANMGKLTAICFCLVIWLRLLVILIPIHRMQAQGRAMFDFLSQHRAPNDENLLLQLNTIRLQIVSSEPQVTAAEVVNLNPHIFLLLISTTIEYGAMLYDISKYFVSTWSGVQFIEKDLLDLLDLTHY